MQAVMVLICCCNQLLQCQVNVRLAHQAPVSSPIVTLFPPLDSWMDISHWDWIQTCQVGHLLAAVSVHKPGTGARVKETARTPTKCAKRVWAVSSSALGDCCRLPLPCWKRYSCHRRLQRVSTACWETTLLLQQHIEVLQALLMTSCQDGRCKALAPFTLNSHPQASAMPICLQCH